MTQTKEEIKIRRKKYYEANKEAVKVTSKRWKDANPEKVATYNKAWYQANSERSVALHKTWRLKQGPIKRMLYSAKARAKKSDTPFDVTKDDIAMPEYCPHFGILLITGDGKLTDNSPTLDRIIPELGYVKGNVMVISNRANRMKSNGTFEELIKLGQWAAEQQSKERGLRDE